jgi:ubiquinone/menaquinone biosynthesis C-methylase UbiE
MQTDNYRKYKTSNPLQRFFINRFLATIIREAKNINPKQVLDAGCGEGFILDRLYKANIGTKLIGIDFSKQAIEIAKRERPHLDIRHGNIYELPFKDNTFDLVLCCEVLEHLTDPEKALAEIQRVAKQYVILSVPNEPFFMLANFLRGKNWSRLGNDIEHIQHWSGKGFENFVSSKFIIFSRKQPFPWTVILGKKR